ncbi:MAG: ATP-binding protein [Candidatus Omnitrophota bacterium]|nr:ATP-binding protein [Candidatus Omnitrophota bacterium]
MIPSVIIVTLTLRPLESFLIDVTDKYLFQKKYDYKKLLKTFISEVLTVLELNRLIKLTKDKLSDIMKLTYCDVVLLPKNAKEETIVSDAELRIPVTLHNETVGMLLLGKKKSDEEYTKDDLDILYPLAKTLGIAISNAQLFEELSKMQTEAAQREKMATIGTLAAGMAHEIRNPITTIRVFSEYVPDKLKESDFRSKYRDVVVKEVDKIDHIIQTLIDFSGDDAVVEYEDVSIGEAISELISLIELNKDIFDRIEFVNNIPFNLPKIRVNRKEFDEILLNLTQNATHAIEEKGRITFNAIEKDSGIELRIEDNGCGISEETLSHIFNPFFTTRRKGYGLGLFVVNELVKRNGGEIFVESKVGKGAKFRLEFRKV